MGIRNIFYKKTKWVDHENLFQLDSVSVELLSVLDASPLIGLLKPMAKQIVILTLKTGNKHSRHIKCLRKMGISCYVFGTLQFLIQSQSSGTFQFQPVSHKLHIKAKTLYVM